MPALAVVLDGDAVLEAGCLGLIPRLVGAEPLERLLAQVELKAELLAGPFQGLQALDRERYCCDMRHDVSCKSQCCAKSVQPSRYAPLVSTSFDSTSDREGCGVVWAAWNGLRSAAESPTSYRSSNAIAVARSELLGSSLQS